MDWADALSVSIAAGLALLVLYEVTAWANRRRSRDRREARRAALPSHVRRLPRDWALDEFGRVYPARFAVSAPDVYDWATDYEFNRPRADETRDAITRVHDGRVHDDDDEYRTWQWANEAPTVYSGGDTTEEIFDRLRADRDRARPLSEREAQRLLDDDVARADALFDSIEADRRDAEGRLP